MMRSMFKSCSTILLILVNVCFSSSLHAHLIQSQSGTLSLSDDGVYLALSLPISAFNDVDENKDGDITMIEFNKQRSGIVSRIEQSIILNENGVKIDLKGIMLSPVPVNHKATGKHVKISQVYVMGKFPTEKPSHTLYFRNTLYGTAVSEQTIKMTAIRKMDGEKQKFNVTLNVPGVSFFTADAQKNLASNVKNKLVKK